MQQHEERKHSLLSPSGAKRWMECPASPTFEEQFGEEGDTSYADEGTLGHEFAETLLRWELLGRKAFPNYAAFNARIEELMSNEYYYDGMLEEVSEYTDYVLQDVTNITEQYIETSLDLSQIAEGMYGHNDFSVYNGLTMTLTVSDLKFGKGVKVSAYDNPQLMLYAAGVYFMLRERGLEVKVIVLQIIQPRMENLDVHTIDEEELLGFIEHMTKAAKEVFKPKPAFKAGNHCQFCKAKARCPELAKTTKEVADAAAEYFNGERVVGLDEYEYYLSLAPSINKFMAAIKLDIARRLNKGENVPNYKLVEGKSSRFFTDKAEVVEILENIGYTADDIYNVQMKPLTAIEKKMGAKYFRANLSHLIGKSKGKPTVAHVDDKRREIQNSAELDFDGITFDEDEE